jgi:flagellar protein FliL
MSNKLLLILVSVLVILMLGLSAGLYMMWNRLSAMEVPAESAAANASPKEPAENLPGPIFSLDTFIVNLADEGGHRYLRVTMDLELVEGLPQDDIKGRLPQIRDSVLMILPTKRFQDISTAQGKAALRDELMAKLNSLFSRRVISNIYFSEFVVQ